MRNIAKLLFTFGFVFAVAASTWSWGLGGFLWSAAIIGLGAAAVVVAATYDVGDW